MEEKQRAYKSMREVKGGRVRKNAQMYKLLTQNIRVGCLVWYFDPRVVPRTRHYFEIILGRTNSGDDVDNSSLGGDQVSGRRKVGEPIDVLKLYQGEDVIHQNPEDMDPDWWLDEGELTELLEIPVEEVEVRVGDQAEDFGAPKVDTGPDLDLPILPGDPEGLAE